MAIWMSNLKYKILFFMAGILFSRKVEGLMLIVWHELPSIGVRSLYRKTIKNKNMSRDQLIAGIIEPVYLDELRIYHEEKCIGGQK